MEASLLHYINEDTNEEYLVIRAEGDKEDYCEDGYKLQNECELLDADITLPIGTIYTRD